MNSKLNNPLEGYFLWLWGTLHLFSDLCEGVRGHHATVSQSKELPKSRK
jgi:hypothetical protein